VPLPSVIEVAPPPNRVKSQVFVPGSKSITNRALVLAALADNPPVLEGALASEDTQVMIEGLRRLGFEMASTPENEASNRTLAVTGRLGKIGPGGTLARPLELQVENAGTATRFLAALVCLGQGSYRLSGSSRMHERPQSPLLGALRELGYRVDSPNDKLPAIIHGTGPHPGAKCHVRLEGSSQFASALLLAAKRGGWEVTVEGDDPEESPYVRMTLDLIAGFPDTGVFRIEPDASSASYFWGANWLLKESEIAVANWMSHSLQIDARFPDVIRNFPSTLSRQNDLGDSIMTAVVLAPFADSPRTFVDLGRLRLQECERVRALRSELTKCGANVMEQGDTLRIVPGPLHGAEIETYNDHRMAMCFAMLGLAVPNIRIMNPACVKKTFPNFFQKLAQIGAVILDEKGKKLDGDDLLAE
jgi:3-phosphoshikimate 1-carboxyvinyltransferase